MNKEFKTGEFYKSLIGSTHRKKGKIYECLNNIDPRTNNNVMYFTKNIYSVVPSDWELVEKPIEKNSNQLLKLV